LRYESLLIDESREEALENMSRFLPVRKSNKWINPQRGKVSQSKDYNKDREQYYLSMQPKQLTRTHIDAINDVLGDRIESMGYDKL